MKARSSAASTHRRPLQRWIRAVTATTTALGLAAYALVATSTAAHAAPTLLSQGKPTTASSVENASFPPANATDGNTGTRWSSAFSDPQWLEVDLGSTASISQVILQWEAAYATAFQIQTSNDNATWTSIYSTTTGTGGTQTLNITGTGRYVRMYGTTRATQWGYSLWEFQVYGTIGGSSGSPSPSASASPSSSPTGSCGAVDEALGQPATSSSVENSTLGPANAFDGNTQTRWSSAFSDPQWVQVDLGVALPICRVALTWEAAYATAFQIQISNDAANWTSIYSTTTGTGGTQTLNVSGTGRYLRMYGTARATQYGYSLWEVTVNTIGDASPPPPPPSSTSPAPGNCTWINSTAPIATRVSQLLAQMTLAQKISMLHGTGASSPYIGDMAAIPALCIPAMGFQDGPAGVGDGMGGVTQMPAPITEAATFDTALEQQYGSAIGAEFLAKGANVDLGPTVNIIRDPRWGRAFETFSEDPYLASQMAVADVKGVQSQGVMAQVKHAAVYNQETNRNAPSDNAIVDARTLNEIYLPAFQNSVTQGATASVMCAYSTINGSYACENPSVLNVPLYQESNFGGFVTSDWGAAHSTVPSVNAGMTVEMPNGYFYADFLNQAVAAGTVTTAQIDTMVTRVLTQMFAFGLFDHAPIGSPSATVTTSAHAKVALQGAEEGTVLLKNSGILPLSTSSLSSIAVIGVDGGAGTQTIGGGSATVTSPGTVWPLTGIQNRVAGTNVTVTYNDGSNQSSATSLAASSSAAIVFASDNYGNEGSDTSTISLPNNQDALISAVAAANPNTIVVLNDNDAILMPWLNSVKAVFEGFYDGQNWGTAIAALLFGDVNPSGKLPVTFPTSLSQVPASTAAQWPGANNQVQYSEGLKVGYRWYDSQNLAPLWPFGFGLSYTTFSFSNLQVGALNNNQATVTATVTNTGTKAGTEVAQLYVDDPASVGEPPHQLKGFQRITLNPGASGTVTFTVAAHDLAHWDTTSSTWQATTGTYQILVGDSSRNLPLSGNLTVPTTITANAATVDGLGSPQAAIANPYGMSSRLGVSASLTLSGMAGLTYTATGLPAGFSISPSGVISGTGTAHGTSTITVTGKAASGVSGSITFVWTVS
ncbi:MAG TPA: glycoside hydrolase family 3 C-terminal domain-containing protein [Actinocrinis sp.]|uniref:glycoside hydrolase family 3 C-terminal domain-containing protein n=1 Tax=Actinocrinis sp. TaxID=1920516 RepID=UPI002DDCF022|nr:glycoside hydrolase family 3 C-terminal domain-containing protein [Actinocrinis sp.]HEV2344371.1 glycoside hydrolase family 3 C-terminal domain-containing protein [Actinocrinis sp.]